MNDSKVSRGRNILLCVLAVLIALVLLFPMLWMLNTSLKTEAEIFMNPPTLYPHTLNLKSYIAQIETGDLSGRALKYGIAAPCIGRLAPHSVYGGGAERA